ncbi:hypothetical protein ACLOJK_005187 [Asimina triloba]
MTATMESISMDEASMKWATPLESADINVSIIAINRKPLACKRAPNDCCPFGQQAASISTASKQSPDLKLWGRNRHPPFSGSSRSSKSEQQGVSVPHHGRLSSNHQQPSSRWVETHSISRPIQAPLHDGYHLHRIISKI